MRLISVLWIMLAASVAVGSALGGEVVPPKPDYLDEPNTIVARFAERSYPAGGIAHLHIATGAARVRLELWRAGLERVRARGDSEMVGRRVGPARMVRPGWVTVRLGSRMSGVYFARLAAVGGKLGFAVVVVRPRRLGEHRVAIVLPTNTWAAYNFRGGATWYANASIHVVHLDRPFLHRGVPFKFRGYDAGFLRWVVQARVRADYFSQEDIERVESGDHLARSYDLIVFPGHHEYVTQHEFDVVERFRDLGGNLAFLSANNFFYRVDRRGDHLYGRWRYRDLRRPEASLVGVQYVDWSHNKWPNRPYVAVGVHNAPWLFRGTGLVEGDRFGTGYGIEIDAKTRASPPGTRILATIPNVFGRGCSAQMTYYETRGGAKVFAAGAMNFGGSATASPVVRRMLVNLFDRLVYRDAAPGPSSSA